MLLSIELFFYSKWNMIFFQNFFQTKFYFVSQKQSDQSLSIFLKLYTQLEDTF